MYFNFGILSSRHLCKDYEKMHMGKINIPGIKAKFNVYKQKSYGGSRNLVTKLGTGSTVFSKRVYTRMLTHKRPCMWDTLSDKCGLN